jgi:hypothetical protein
MQKVIGIAVVCLPLYGLVRSAGMLTISLDDTENQFHTFDLQCGIFWDSASIRKINRADTNIVSNWNEVSIRQMAIKHTMWDHKQD